jgi:hypothetical protein
MRGQQRRFAPAQWQGHLRLSNGETLMITRNLVAIALALGTSGLMFAAALA